MKALRTSLVLILASMFAWGVVSASPPDTVTICHAAGVEDTTQYVTLTLPYNAVYGPAGHFAEPGTPNAGHEQDYEGSCVLEPDPSSTATPVPPTDTPVPAPTDTPDEATPTDEPEVPPSDTPVPTDTAEPTSTPTPTDTDEPEVPPSATPTYTATSKPTEPPPPPRLPDTGVGTDGWMVAENIELRAWEFASNVWAVHNGVPNAEISAYTFWPGTIREFRGQRYLIVQRMTVNPEDTWVTAFGETYTVFVTCIGYDGSTWLNRLVILAVPLETVR